MQEQFPSLTGDSAGVSIDQDQFGLAAMAKAMAGVLTGRVSADGYVIGIEGEWGSGKTTLVNFILEQIKKDAGTANRVIRCEPWLVSTREKLLGAFFASLIAEFTNVAENSAFENELTATRKSLRKLIGKLTRYANYLDATGSMLKIASQFDPSGHCQIVRWGIATVSWVLHQFQPKPVNLEDLRREIVGDLQALSKLVPTLRFTVLIDDLDRLEPAESVEILRLVKAVANFPLVTYVICYDRRILVDHVDCVIGKGAGADYLEKIFQNIVPMPPQEAFALRRFLQTKLADMFTTEMGTLPEDDRDGSYREHLVFDKWAGEFVRTPRDVTRVCDAIALNWPQIRGRGDFLDCVWLQLIKYGVPEFYAWVRRYVSTLGAYRDGGRAGDDEPQRMAKELSDILRKQNWETHAYLSGIDYFLPGTKEFVLQGDKQKVFAFERGDLEKFEKGRRLGSPSHWRQYFAFDVPTYAIRDEELSAFRQAASQSDEGAIEFLRGLMKRPHQRAGHYVEVLLARLENSPLSTVERKGVVSALVGVMDGFALGRMDFGRPALWRPAAKLWNSDIVTLFMESLSSGVSINWLADILREQGFAHGRPEKSRSEREPSWLTEAELDNAIDVAVERFKHEGLPKIARMPEPLAVLYCWLQLGNGDELKELIERDVQDDTVFLDVMDAMRGWLSGSEGVRRPLYERYLKSFMDSVVAKLRLEKLAAGKGNAGLTPKAKELLNEWSEE